MPSFNRRAFLQTTAAVSVIVATGANAQTAWPDHNVRIIVPYPAGGSIDVLARILAERMKEMFGHSFVIDNRPGAGGNLGITSLTGSPPDGYTIAAATIGHYAINPFLYEKMPYDTERDLITATLTWELPNALVVATDHCPAKTVSEFLIWAKQKGRLSLGSPGVGTSPHLSGVLFAKRAGIDIVHVPFRGAAQTIPAMLSGDVDFALDNLTSYISTIESGKIRALAITSAERLPTMPSVPTMADAGIKDFVVTSWATFVFPVGTPRPIVDKLANAMKQMAADPEIQKRFLMVGARCISSTPEQAVAYAARERARWKEVVALSGAKAQ